MQRILGIDPGSRVTGIGIIESDGQYSRAIYNTAVRLKQEDALPVRLGEIFSNISQLIQQYQPDEVSVENVFMSNNAASALKLGQARGAAICAAVVNAVPVYEYSPREIKQAVVGKGAADKQQIQHMVKILLNLQGKLQSDSADALAIALCHAHTNHLKKRIHKAESR